MIKFVLGMVFGMWLCTYGIDNAMTWMSDTASEYYKMAKEDFVKDVDDKHFSGEK